MTDDSELSAAAPFELLANEVRTDILEALVEARRKSPREPYLQFSELRERAGVADSGQFNYHLDKLRGQFVQQDDQGYRLSSAGLEVVGAVLGGTFEDRATKGPAPIDDPCGYCGAPVTARYEDGVLQAECEDGHTVHRAYIPPSIAERFAIPTAMEIAALLGHHRIELLLRGVCSDCYGPATTRLFRGEDGDPNFEAQCDRCGFYLPGPPGLLVLTHPALRAYFLDRDRDVRTASLWSLPFLVEPDRYAIESEDPLQVSITVGDPEDGLRYRVDEECSILEYERLTG